MDIAYLGQHLVNGLMLGVIYAMVAVGFTLFFGVLDVIKFSHGDILTLGAFTGLASYLGLTYLGLTSPWLLFFLVTLAAVAAMGVLGAAIGRFFVLPLRAAPPFNTLLITLMVGTVLRESIRLFYPSGSNPQSFPALLPGGAWELGALALRADSLILITVGLAVIWAVNLVVNHSRLGLAIRAVAQDAETARVMGIDFTLVVLVTFAIGSGLAALAGVMHGLYYNEIYFGTGLMLGVIGFSAAVIGGLGSIYGAILGGFLFAAIQVAVVLVLPAASAYKDVIAFALVIVLIGFQPTGLIAEKRSERV